MPKKKTTAKKSSAKKTTSTKTAAPAPVEQKVTTIEATPKKEAAPVKRIELRNITSQVLKFSFIDDNKNTVPVEMHAGEHVVIIPSGDCQTILDKLVKKSQITFKSI